MDRKIAPTVILILLIIFILGYAGTIAVVLSREEPVLFWTLFFVLAPLAVIGALIAVYVERIREIDDGSEDDLENY